MESNTAAGVDARLLETWLAALGENLTENGVIVYDAGGRVALANASARRILGRPIPVGSSFLEQEQALAFEEIDATPLPPSEHPVALALRGVETHDRNVFAARSGGDARVAIILDATPLRGPDGRAQGALLVLRDMGEEQRAAAFREAFLARAGHELRNPLGALTTAAQILARRAKKRGDPPDRALEIVLESVQNLTKLVEELLDLSRIGRGRLELERTPNTPLGPILVAAAEDTRRVFPEANVEVLVAGEICTGTWDATRLRQAVRHLIENAIVHGKPPIDVKAMAVGPDSVTFRVRDHGEGVPPARRDEVLRPFVRRDRNVGLGLGLAIVTEIARAHGGRCWIGDPEDGQSGCAAFFQIPLANGS